ncbi:MAG: right-handed parallel beta-helix repeat-containing protein, partial [Bacteroidota bacterium]
MKKSATSKRKKRAFISAILMSMTFMFSCDLSAQPEAIPESKILNWNKAGRSAFIPDAPSVFDSSSMVAVNLKASGTASTTEIQKAIKAAKNTKKRWVWLPNARYFVNAPIKMEPNVALLGQSKSGVILLMRLTSGNAISMFKDDNSGVSRLTLLGSYRMHDDSILDRDPINFWSCPSCNEQDSISTISIRINRSSQCWVDDVEIINSGRHPLVLGPTAQNNTIRNVYARGAHNKGGGANGYFFIQGSYNLITKCRATHLRHISIQGSSAEWNVLYNNDFEQEVSFHVGDNGNNLLERNTITLPEDIPDAYYAVMGTWSTQHDKGKINYLYRNALTQLNRDPIRLFSGQAS